MSDGSLGRFYGVGVGPGDPELITRKAERVVEDLESLRGQELPYFSLVILRKEGT